MITAKTVDSVVGPPPPRPRPRSDRRETADVKDRILQIVAAGLLVTGAICVPLQGLNRATGEESERPFSPNRRVSRGATTAPIPTKGGETLPPH